MTNLEAKKHLARKLNIDYADIANNDLFSEEDLQVFIQLGLIKAWDYRMWPGTRKAKKSTTIDTPYYDYPSEIVLGSINRLRVGGKEFKKLIEEDYFKHFEDFPNSTKRIWTETETFIFVNQNAYTVGEILCLFGKKYAPTLTSDEDVIPLFPTEDDYENSGNEAIVQLGYAEALDSEKKQKHSQAEVERKKAYQTLDVLWKPIAEFRALQQSENRPMFNTPDFFGSGGGGSQYTGNFNYLN